MTATLDTLERQLHDAQAAWGQALRAASDQTGSTERQDLVAVTAAEQEVQRIRALIDAERVPVSQRLAEARRRWARIVSEPHNAVDAREALDEVRRLEQLAAAQVVAYDAEGLARRRAELGAELRDQERALVDARGAFAGQVAAFWELARAYNARLAAVVEELDATPALTCPELGASPSAVSPVRYPIADGRAYEQVDPVRILIGLARTGGR